MGVGFLGIGEFGEVGVGVGIRPRSQNRFRSQKFIRCALVLLYLLVTIAILISGLCSLHFISVGVRSYAEYLRKLLKSELMTDFNFRGFRLIFLSFLSKCNIYYLAKLHCTKYQ